MVTPSRASAGMVPDTVPALKAPTVITTGSKTLKVLVTKVWRARTIALATGIGSLARCGMEPWPPAPATVTFRSSVADMIGPRRVRNTP
ncbi:hypothetical protein GCM10027176_11420 [Actinoallomurus bryophytorum]